MKGRTMRKASLGAKLAALNIAVLAACCLALAATLNHFAFAMADTIEATVAPPAQSVDVSSGNDGSSAVTAAPQDGDSGATAGPASSDSGNAAGVIQEVDDASGSEAFDADAGLAATTPSVDARTAYLATSATVVLVIVAAGGGLTYWIVSRETRGIAELARHVRGCTPDELGKPFEGHGKNRETTELIAAFNGLGGRVANAMESQRRFALAAAHELKTPLAVMRTRLDVFAKRAEPTRGDTLRLTTALSTQTDRLAELVRQLLVLARSETIARADVIDPALVVRSVAEEVSLATGASIACELAPAVASIRAGQALFCTAVRNALQNAVEHGEGSVLVACESGRLVVSNAGAPIQADLAERLFEPFFRTDASRAHVSDGCGLGLATTRAIMRAHGGDARFLPCEDGVSLELTWDSGHLASDATAGAIAG